MQHHYTNGLEKIHLPGHERYYYGRPSPIDLLYEEEDTKILTYDPRKLYEWNFDGASDHQIYKIIHRMLIYTTVVQSKGYKPWEVVNAITSGFTGILKGWWDNYLSQEMKNDLLSTTRLDDNTKENDEAVYTLIHNILEHFVGWKYHL